MRKLVDLAGKKFGAWLVLRRAPNETYPNADPQTAWLCRCSCGREKTVPATRLKRGNSTRCVECYYDTYRVPPEKRVCRWCGGSTKKQQAGFTECWACAKASQRERRFPCGKPRRKRPPRGLVVKEHSCGKCELWPQKKERVRG